VVKNAEGEGGEEEGPRALGPPLALLAGGIG